MQYWNIKEVADMLGITAQAIYKNKEEYLKKGYIEKNEDGNYKINITGYNYLINRTRKKTEKEEPIQIKENLEIQREYIENLKEQINLLQNQLKENRENYLKEIEQERTRTLYFKELFEQKDKQISLYLLPGAREEKTETKKGFFQSLFNR